MLLPGLLRLGQHELLDLLELVYPEDATNIPAGAAGLPAEARRNAHVPEREPRPIEALSPVEGGDRLLRSGDQVLIELRLVLVFDHLVEDIIVVCKLRGLAHQVFLHEERRLESRVATHGQEREAVIDQRLIQQHAGAHEEIAAGSGDVAAFLEGDGADHLQKFEMRPEAVRHVLDARERARGAPHGDDLVVFLLVLGHRDGVVNDIPDAAQLLVALLKELVRDLLQLRFLALEFLLLLEQVLALVLALGSLLLLRDLVLDLSDLLSLLLRVVVGLDPLLVDFNDLVDELRATESSALGLLHRLGIAAFVLAQELDADGHRKGWL
mmetsp:Transcript_115027/g.330461  ORF Transcript_115027/g.330461 Transcript_115027/m.330461 type:complete len:325 (+) Transcript_115027:568-1542(+)